MSSLNYLYSWMKLAIVLLNSVFWHSPGNSHLHFYRTGGLWRGEVGLVFHIVCIFIMISGPVDFFCSVSDVAIAGWGRGEVVWACWV